MAGQIWKPVRAWFRRPWRGHQLIVWVRFPKEPSSHPPFVSHSPWERLAPAWRATESAKIQWVLDPVASRDGLPLITTDYAGNDYDRNSENTERDGYNTPGNHLSDDVVSLTPEPPVRGDFGDDSNEQILEPYR